MKFEIYHQLGYRYKWNLESITRLNTGDGIILSPKHIRPDEISTLQFPKNKTIFDPQFFLPNQASGKLKDYPFFPCSVIPDFKTNSFSSEKTQNIAKACIGYQKSNQFEYIIIPARPYGNNPGEYIQEQEKLFVKPFLSEIQQLKEHEKIILQVVINKSFILDSIYFDELLNWITSLIKIDGVYLIIQTDYKTKQIEDINFLYALLNFIYILAQLNDLIVILGYMNLESILLSLSGPSIITIGSYENTRHFDIENFIEKQRDEKQQGPTPRLYMSKLLQLIDYRYIDSIKAETGESIFDDNEYQATMFQPTYHWHFQKPEQYKHFFLVFSAQLRSISTLPLNERYFVVKDMLNSAIRNYEKLEELISFDRNSRGTHLSMWLTAANRFAKQRGWL